MICLRCGHPACPHCKNWCDAVVHVAVTLDDGTTEPDAFICCDCDCLLVDAPICRVAYHGGPCFTAIRDEWGYLGCPWQCPPERLYPASDSR